MNYGRTLLVLLAFALSFPSYSQWETEALPDGRSEIASVAIGDNIYFVGGATSGTQRYFKMNVFNVPTQIWTTVDVPNGTKGPRTIAIEEKIYFGDIEGDRTIYVYDTETEIWGEISVPGIIGTLTHMDDLIIVESSGDLLLYDMITEEWTDFDFDYNPNATVAAANGKIVIAGGSNNIVRIYDIETDTWSQSALSLERDEPRAVANGTKMYFIGGEAAGFEWTGRIDVFETEDNSWSIDSLSVSRNRFDVTVYNDKLIVAGGQIISFSNQWRKEVDILDLNSNTWETVEMPTGRRYPSVVGHEDKIYIAGGDANQSNLDLVEIYTLTVSSTTELLKQDLSIYPNPTSDVLSLKTINDVEQLQVVDVHGRNMNIPPRRNGENYELEVSHLSPGIYFLRINKQSKPLKFIKK